MKKFILLIGFFSIMTAFGFENKEQLIIEKENEDVKITSKDVLANCCSLFDSEHYWEENTLIIIQRDTSVEKCHCMCYFDLISIFRDILPGNYKVQIWREELKKYNYPQDSLFFVAEADFEVLPNLQMPPYMYIFEQSDCNHSTYVEELPSPGYYPETQVFPNPVQNSAYFEIASIEDKEGIISVYDIYGRLCVYNNSAKIAKGNNHLRIDTAELAPGIYSGSFISGGEIVIFRFVVSK